MNICAIVLDYHGAERTKKCLLSLVGQGINTILVVDNSEDDRATNALNSVICQIKKGAALDYKIKILTPSHNLGFGNGVNFALQDKAAQASDFMLLINNDAIASPELVRQLVSTLNESNIDLIAPQIIDDGGKIQPMLWYQRYISLLTPYQLPLSFPYLSGCCLLFRRELVHTGKLFDADFFMYGEDTLLGWQLNRSGKTMLIDTSASVRHIGQGSSSQYKFFYEFHMARAHILLATKTWTTRLEIPLLLIGKFFSLGVRSVLRCIRSRSLVPLFAFTLAWFPLSIRKVK